MFSNAGIQGMYRVMSSAWKNNGVKAMLGGVVTMGALMEIMMHAIAGDDEDGVNHYSKIPDWVKRSNLILMDPAGSGRAITIPLPYVISAFWSLGNESAAMFAGHKTPAEGTTSMMASFADSFNPLGGGGDPAQIVFPTLMKPFYQFGANVDWKGDPIKPEPFPFGLKKPQSQQAWKSVSPSAKWLATRLNSFTGGDAVVPGAVDVSPEYIEHFGDFMLGGVGRFVRRTEAAVEKAFAGEDIDVSRGVPFVRRVFWTPDQRYQRNQYRENQESVEQLSARVKAYRTSGEAEKAAALISENPDLWRMVTPMKASQRRVRVLNKRVKRNPEAEESVTTLLQAEYLRINKMLTRMAEAR